MKRSLLPLLVLLPLVCNAGEKTKRYRDAVSHEQLVERMRRMEQANPMAKLEPSEGEDPSKVNKPVNLLEQSDVVCFQGLATLVPKRAILSAPAGVRGRMNLAPGSKIVRWAEFYRLNRGWITTVEVSRTQAEGNELIAEEKRDRISKSRNLVVATYMGGPISVLEAKEPTSTETEQ